MGLVATVARAESCRPTDMGTPHCHKFDGAVDADRNGAIPTAQTQV